MEAKSSVLHIGVRACKTCKKDKELSEFPPIKRKNSTTYRNNCRVCEAAAARSRAARRTGHKKEQEFIKDTGTDPAFFRDDAAAKMPSETDMLYWSTPYFDEMVALKDVLMNKIPENK